MRSCFMRSTNRCALQQQPLVIVFASTQTLNGNTDTSTEAQYFGSN